MQGNNYEKNSPHEVICDVVLKDITKGKELIHFDEQTLSLYILNAPEVKTIRVKIAKHLRKCSGCASLHKELSEYYEEIQALQETQGLKTLQVVSPRRLLESYASRQRMPVHEASRNVSQRFVESIRLYPIRWSAGFAMAIAAVLLLTRYPAENTNPAYARAKEEFLIVYNDKGEELWRKHVGIRYDFETAYQRDQSVSLENFITTVDVNRDGTKEIIALFGWVPKPLGEKRNAVVCYRNDGSELWRYEFSRQMTFGTEKFSDNYALANMVASDFNRDGKLEITAAASHSPYYPQAIIVLDAESGKLLDEYWHSGIAGKLLATDIDNDGTVEILVAGGNNGYNLASVVVLDPRMMSGHAPAPPAYTPLGIQPGKEKYYLLLPRTDVNKSGTEKRNSADYIRITPEGLLEVGTQELQSIEPPPGIIYYFDSAMKCVRVIGNDYFVEAHTKLLEAGKITMTLDEQYEQLKRGIRYWDGEKFVKETTISKNYLNELKHSTPIIERLSPNPMTGKTSIDTLTIEGHGFRPGLTVLIQLLDHPGGVFRKVPVVLTPTRAVIALRVGTDPSRWTVQVINPDSSNSAIHPLSVIAPHPEIPWLDPPNITAGSEGFVLTITGTTFTSSSIVKWNGQERPTKPVVNKGGLVLGLVAEISSADIAAPSIVEITVYNPGPSGGVSKPAIFKIVATKVP